MEIDLSNGYEAKAAEFARIRANSTIGVEIVKKWAKRFPKDSRILDLGCGSGISLSKAIADQKLLVYGIDASPSLVQKFKINLPDNPVICEPVETSDFYNLKFNAIMAWGVLFLLPEEKQLELIRKVGNHLVPQGEFLFTAPYQKTAWADVLTGQSSQSLGLEKYVEILKNNNLKLIDRYTDEGQNHYYHCQKN